MGPAATVPEIVDAELVDDLTNHFPVLVAEWDVIDVEPYRSPLDPKCGSGVEAYPTVLRGGVVTDPQQITEIAARCAYGRLPWWQRVTTPTPVGWRTSVPRLVDIPAIAVPVLFVTLAVWIFVAKVWAPSGAWGHHVMEAAAGAGVVVWAARCAGQWVDDRIEGWRHERRPR